MKNPPKLKSVLNLVKTAYASGDYVFTRHASERGAQRDINRADVAHVLEHGYHEKAKDAYNAEKSGWNYAIRCYLEYSERDIRVIVAFDTDIQMFVITLIAIGEG